MPTYYRDKEDFVIIPRGEVDKMIETAKSPRMKTILRIIYLTGARIGEVLNLERKDFETIDGVLFIRFKTLKGGVPRELKLGIDSTPFVPDIIRFVKRKKGRIFNIGVRRAEQLLLDINEKTGYWYTFHEFRHSRISFLAHKQRASLYELMEWTGWKSPSVVGTYLIRQSSDRFKDKIE